MMFGCAYSTPIWPYQHLLGHLRNRFLELDLTLEFILENVAESNHGGDVWAMSPGFHVSVHPIYDVEKDVRLESAHGPTQRPAMVLSNSPTKTDKTMLRLPG